MSAAEAGHRRAALIAASFCAISDEKFCGADFFSKFSVRDAPQNASDRARRVVPVHGKAVQDLCGCRRAMWEKYDTGIIPHCIIPI